MPVSRCPGGGGHTARGQCTSCGRASSRGSKRSSMRLNLAPARYRRPVVSLPTTGGFALRLPTIHAHAQRSLGLVEIRTEHSRRGGRVPAPPRPPAPRAGTWNSTDASLTVDVTQRTRRTHHNGEAVVQVAAQTRPALIGPNAEAVHVRLVRMILRDEADQKPASSPSTSSATSDVPQSARGTGTAGARSSGERPTSRRSRPRSFDGRRPSRPLGADSARRADRG